MGRQWGAAACALALAGCVSVENIPMSAGTADALKGREISLSERAKPDFGAMTAGRMAGGALFGAIGGAVAGNAMVSAGNEIVQQNGIQDPAEQIGAALSGALGAKFGARPNAPRTQLSTDEATEARNAQGSDLVLDVRTINWGFVYFPTSWSKYRVMYTARTRLIDAKKGQVLAEAGCAAPIAENADAAPTYEELLAEGAARLKKELAQATEFCAGEFASKMFSLDLAQYRSTAAPLAAAPASKKAEAPVQTARAAPAATVAAAKGLPLAGTLWKYRFEDRKFANRKRDFSVQLAGAAGSAVTETFATGGNQQTYTSNSQAIDFLVRSVDSEPVYELAPYLLAHMPAPSTPPAHRPAYSGSASAEPGWEVRIAEVRREQVQVPAGRFEAVRMRITGENPTLLHSSNSSAAMQMATSDFRTQRFEYTVWYVPEIGRYVQSRHQTFNRLGNAIGDEWVQLSSIERPDARR